MSISIPKPALVGGWRIRLASSSSTSTSTTPLHRRRRRRRLYNTYQPFQNIPVSHAGYAKLRSEPLRILFCGSDLFSTASLRALYDLMQANPALVESLDVLVRPGKAVGRKRDKKIRTGPCYDLAKELALPVHERDTFKGWDLPRCGHVSPPNSNGRTTQQQQQHQKTIFPHPTKPGVQRYARFNLIIAVSFGLFVPPRILDAVQYGGLNLHPSLLPDLPGPAPVPWTILAQRPVTGVTLQTLHPAAYDRGVILAQTPAPGIPVPEDATAVSLLAMLADEGAKMLVQALTQELHVPPYEQHVAWWPPPPSSSSPGPPQIIVRDAPKLDTKNAHIDWRCRTWGADKTLYPTGRLTASDIVRAHRAALYHTEEEGRKTSGLRTHALLRDDFVPPKNKGFGQSESMAGPSDKRVILTDIEAVPCPPLLRDVVGAIVQIRRTALLSSALEEGEEEEEYGVDSSSSSGGTWDVSPPSPEINLSEAMTMFAQAAGEDISQYDSWRSTDWDKKPKPTKGVTIGRIAWSIPDDEVSNLVHETVRVPVMVDQKAGTVTVPVGVPYRIENGGKIIAVVDNERPLDAVRIKTAKVEGSFTKPASQALLHFLQRPLLPMDVQREEYAVDVMARRLE